MSIEVEELTKRQQSAIRAFERVMASFVKQGLMMFNWSGGMYVFRAEDYERAMEAGVSLSTVSIDVDNHGMQSDGGDPD